MAIFGEGPRSRDAVLQIGKALTTDESVVWVADQDFAGAAEFVAPLGLSRVSLSSQSCVLWDQALELVLDFGSTENPISLYSKALARSIPILSDRLLGFESEVLNSLLIGEALSSNCLSERVQHFFVRRAKAKLGLCGHEEVRQVDLSWNLGSCALVESMKDAVCLLHALMPVTGREHILDVQRTAGGAMRIEIAGRAGMRASLNLGFGESYFRLNGCEAVKVARDSAWFPITIREGYKICQLAHQIENRLSMTQFIMQ